jgi:hypothetical protein
MNVKKLIYLPIILILSWMLVACHDVEQLPDDPEGNFEQLWQILDQHYCFFAQKSVDWDDVHTRYRQRISAQMTREELFDVCAEMLDELRDGHTNLVAPFQTSYYRKWWSDYPQNYQARIVEEYYLNFDYRSTCGIDYAMLPENVGYMHYSSFSTTVGDGNLDAILAYFATANGLIIDVRDNGGGSMTNVETIVARFISEKTRAGTICHKNGPGHDDFSEPYPFYYSPAEQGRIMWGKPVIVLCNRSTFSAANIFVSVMKSLPNVTIVGATTGGGSGMPFSSELTSGWSVRFSASPLRDPEGNLTEFGVEPSDGCAVDMDLNATLEGHDTILDFAINRLTSAN